MSNPAHEHCVGRIEIF